MTQSRCVKYLMSETLLHSQLSRAGSERQIESPYLQKTRAPKIPLPHCISHEKVRDPPGLEKGTPKKLRKGTRLREWTPLKLGLKIRLEVKEGDPLK